MVRAACAVAAAVAALALGVAGPALAHAVLLESDPADGTTVDDELAEVRLTFDEPVAEPRVAVAGPDGEDLADGAARADGEVVTLPVATPHEHGEHRLAFRVVSDDGHPVDDELTFDYQGPLDDEGSSHDEPDVADEPADDEADEPDDALDEADEPGDDEADEPGDEEGLAAAEGDDEGGVPWTLIGLGALVAAAVAAVGTALGRGGGHEP